MKKLTKICLLLAAATTWGSDPQVKAQGTFQKTYGGGSAFDEIITSDGYIVVTGDPYFLMKMDQNGSMIWHKSYSSVSGGMTGSSVYQTTDGGFIIGGTLNNGGPTSKATLVKTDSNGNFQWANTYGGSMYEEIHDARQTLDGGYIAIGCTRSFGQLIDVYLIKTNSAGSLLWSKNFGSNGFDYGNSIIQNPDSGYVICGSLSLSGSGNDVLVTNVDKSGNIVWIKTYGGTGDDRGQAIISTLDGGYNVAGYTESFGAGGADAYLIKTNSIGGLSWSKAFGSAYGDQAYSVEEISGGGYFLSGFGTSTSFPGRGITAIKLNVNGDTIWSKVYGDQGEVGFTAKIMNKNYFVAGNSQSLSSNDIYLVKADSLGNTSCYVHNLQPIITTPPTIISNPSVVISTSSTVVTPIVFSVSNVATENILCSLVSVPETPVELLDFSGMEPWAIYNLFLQPLPKGSIPSAGIYLCEYKVGEKSFFRKVFLPSR